VIIPASASSRSASAGEKGLKEVIDLGHQPLGDSPLRETSHTIQK